MSEPKIGEAPKADLVEVQLTPGWLCRDVAAASARMIPTPREIGASNREAVRAFLRSHLGCTRTEIAEALGLSVMAVGRHVAAIRQEWGAA